MTPPILSVSFMFAVPPLKFISQVMLGLPGSVILVRSYIVQLMNKRDWWNGKQLKVWNIQMMLIEQPERNEASYSMVIWIRYVMPCWVWYSSMKTDVYISPQVSPASAFVPHQLAPPPSPPVDGTQPTCQSSRHSYAMSLPEISDQRLPPLPRTMSRWIHLSTNVPASPKTPLDHRLEYFSWKPISLCLRIHYFIFYYFSTVNVQK